MYSIMPFRYKKMIDQLLVHAGSHKNPKQLINNLLALSLAVGIGVAFIARGQFLLVFAASSFGFFVLFHGLLVLAVERRTGFVEEILPDALQLMASNSRAGYIPSRAFLMSARDEFGPLAEAIRHVGRELMTGKPIENALKDMNKYIRSEMLERTLNLIAEGIRSGGNFASLLEENANDIRRISTIKKEMQANITMYIIFIVFAAAFGAPLFYSLSGFLIRSLGSIGGDFELPSAAVSQMSFLKFGTVKIEPEFMAAFSVVAIIITTFFGGLILGLISTGKEKGGIKFIPVLMAIALIIYFVSGIFIETAFSSFIPQTA